MATGDDYGSLIRDLVPHFSWQLHSLPLDMDAT